jgi:alpha-N-acetylglucosamine transferase
MKKLLLVTLSTSNRLNDAKQLFSGVYFNGGWEGDYMLLAHEIPEEELKWFRDKGIFIKKCQPLTDKKVPYHPACVLDKFYLFTPEFKKWDNIVYIDSDILVRASIKKLAEVKGFWAVCDCYSSLKYHFIKRKAKKRYIKKSNEHNKITKISQEGYGWNLEKAVLVKKLKKEFDLRKAAFNTGVLAFSTDIIRDDTFSRLTSLMNEYMEISLFADQGILNLFFYKRWKHLPINYNLPALRLISGRLLENKKVRIPIIHLFKKWLPRLPQDFFITNGCTILNG